MRSTEPATSSTSDGLDARRDGVLARQSSIAVDESEHILWW